MPPPDVIYCSAFLPQRALLGQPLATIVSGISNRASRKQTAGAAIK
ncbi:hypothetical protein EKH55_2029 [Sinorhizobium alkalisoli]|nr:hypothetical protein EKH55_2029 [Sinorhizobium alkalisoli]